MSEGTIAVAEAATGSRARNLILAAMIFAVSMTFIDQTIVSIAVPQIQKELGLTSTGVQWAVNAYLLSLAALFAFGGRLADTMGHKRMVVLGVIVFAGASALCGLTPKGSLAETWIVAFRAVQGVGGAIMFPAALAIVVQTFELRERGKALALFFGIAGGLTAVGPILGGVLTQWTWRAIFWVNIPVALIALVLIAIAKPVTVYRPARTDYRGVLLIAAGVALSVFGFQQSSTWGWSNPGIWACIAGGIALIVVFAVVEERTPSPLMNVSIFRVRAFLVENLVLNRASRLSYGEATGITQTVRNFAASLGLAILGTILVDKLRTHVAASLVAQGLPHAQASSQASHIAEESQGSGSGGGGAIPHFIRLDFAQATHTVLLCMAGVMAAAAVVAFVGLRRGVQVETDASLVGAD